MNNQLTRTDTIALVGSVLLGIVFVIACQAAGFIDNMLPTGKMGMYLINGSIWATFTALIVLMYKQPAGIIAGEVQALFSILFSPLWIAFVFANAVASLAVSAVASKYSMDRWSHYALALFWCNVMGNAIVGVGLYLIFHLPANVAIIQSAITTLVCWPISTVLTKMTYEGIKKSGLIR
jgi:hypothetical protein